MAKCETTPLRNPHSDGGFKAARANRPIRLHPTTDKDSSNWSSNGASALMLEDLCAAGGPATCKMPHATTKIIAKRMAILVPVAGHRTGYRFARRGNTYCKPLSRTHNVECAVERTRGAHKTDAIDASPLFAMPPFQDPIRKYVGERESHEGIRVCGV